LAIVASSGIARERAGENLDQRRLARAVMTDDSHDFAGVKIDRCPIDGAQTAERERNVAHLDERYAFCLHPVLSCHEALRRR
jgi:hypothetical protein